MIGDRIEQTTTTEGTGTLTLNAPPTGRLAFSDEIPPGEKVYYIIENGDDWEEGIGTVGANSLSRDTLIRSSTGSKLNLSGTSVVRCAPIAEWFGGMGGRLRTAQSVTFNGSTYIITTRPAIRALVDGVEIEFRANETDTAGGAQADVSSTGAKPIRKSDFAPVEPFDIQAGRFYKIKFDATSDCWQLISPIFRPGPSAIINGDFRVSQRGTVFAGIVNNQYLVDRVRYLVNADGGTPATVQASQETFTPGQSDVPFEPINYLRLQAQDVGSSLGAGSYAVLEQPIEDVRSVTPGRWTNQIWMRSSISGKRVGFRLFRVFGSGGSASESNTKGESFTLSTLWQPLPTHWTVPTLSGLTVGDDSSVRPQIWLQWGENFDDLFGTSGGEGWRGTGTIDIADWSFHPGHLIGPFQRRHIAAELALCQRYYVHRLLIGGAGYATSGGQTERALTTVNYPVQMRVDPAKTYTALSGNMSGTLHIAQSDAKGMVCGEIAATGPDSQFWRGRVNLDAEL